MPPATPPVAWEFRQQTLICTEGLLRMLHAALDSYDDDLESTVIYLAVCCASVGGGLRNLKLSTNPPAPGPMDPRHFRLVSRRAIAASTGLPRETVRRKIAAFVERGDLIAEGRGVRIRHGLLEDPRNREFALAMIREFSRVGGQLQASP